MSGKPKKPARGSKPSRPSKARPARSRDVGELSGEVRLQKLLARAGVSSRRGGEALITAGRVKVNGQVVTELGTKVDPMRDRVAVDNKLVEAEPPIYLVVNKPDGFVCSAEPKVDDRGRPTIISLLRGIDARVFPVGRLDYHTRGVLLVTNDGEFASRLLHPRYQVPKTYHAKFQGRLDNEAVDKLKAGVTLEDGTVTRPVDELLVIKDTEANTWVQMTISQGLNRQIRRMGEAIGHPVLKLLRVAFADVTADDLPEGQFRRLREPELGDLRARTGLQGGPSSAGPNG
ncbi:MAG: pseudouridine synthase [Myxococcota bacterium]